MEYDFSIIDSLKEYIEPRESNFEFKVLVDQNNEIILYSNISPKGTQWEETEMTDYIIND